MYDWCLFAAFIKSKISFQILFKKIFLGINPPPPALSNSVVNNSENGCVNLNYVKCECCMMQLV